METPSTDESIAANPARLAPHCGSIGGSPSMIPAFNLSGVLPPFDASLGPAAPGSMSPYDASMSEFAGQFATSDERVELLLGLLEYRERLRLSGMTDGFQWIDGSFIEDIETIRGRPPADIDLVTFASRPAAHAANWTDFVDAHPELFDQDESKAQFHCHAFFVDMTRTPEYVIDSTAYWFGLFSHQRESALWKGLVRIPIQSDDELVLAALAPEEGADAQEA